MPPGVISRAAPAGSPSHNSSKESNGRNKSKRKNKNRSNKSKRRKDDALHPSSPRAAAAHPNSDMKKTRAAPPLSKEHKRAKEIAAHPNSDMKKTRAAPPLSKEHKRAKEIPARFSHPQLGAELRRLRRSWLSPGDPLFQPVLNTSYRGMRHVPAGALPKTLHDGFRQSFDELHEAGLFMYDTVQAGGKRLTRTFVTRTLLGDPGITYKYLGLRLFAHPWDRGTAEFRKGPGDSLADALADPCLSDLFRNDGASHSGGGGGGGGGGGSDVGADKVADTLRNVGALSECMRLRAAALLKEEREESGRGGGGGSCAFNLTLINRMESSGTKRDLKPDPLFAMGKCSVSWHADSCLQDFSTIGVYHCTDPVPAEPDWGIALRVSKEAEAGGGDDGGGEGNSDAVGATRSGEARRRPGGEALASPGKSSSSSAAAAAPGKQEPEISTPPLLVPLQSGDAYFLLDDFNHFHEHAVVSGSSTLRYSSTHRVAVTDGNTFSHVQKRCEEVLAGGDALAAEPGRILDLVQVRAEQALLTELEFEWLNQFWVQGRRHAVLHPWWRGPMALVLATWRELERRTAATVQRLLSLRDNEAAGDGGDGAARGAADPPAVARAFETVLRALEERRESRSRWAARFADSAYRSLPPDCAPVVPALWLGGGGGGGGGGGDGEDGSLLPRALDGAVSRLRACYTVVYRAASGGQKACSAKALAAGAASNWELFRSASSSGQAKVRVDGALKQQKQQQQQQQQQRRHRSGSGTDGSKRPAGGSFVGGRTGGGGTGGRGPKRKGKRKRREGK